MCGNSLGKVGQDKIGGQMSDENASAISTSVLNEIGNAAPIRQLNEFIERLDASADVKALLRDMANLTVTIGGHLVAIGRKIVSFAIELYSRFPNTIFGCVIAFIMAALISSVPLLGPVLGAVLTPLLLALGIGMGALNDMFSAPLKAEVRGLAKRLATLEAGT